MFHGMFSTRLQVFVVFNHRSPRPSSSSLGGDCGNHDDCDGENGDYSGDDGDKGLMTVAMGTIVMMRMMRPIMTR